jgi:hypothetical protein
MADRKTMSAAETNTEMIEHEAAMRKESILAPSITTTDPHPVLDTNAFIMLLDIATDHQHGQEHIDMK